MNGYNGWTNYETWRINLEVTDGMTTSDFGVRDRDLLDPQTVDILSESIESYAEEIILGEIPEGLALGLAADFLNRVNWEEIAEHMIADAKAEA